MLGRVVEAASARELSARSSGRLLSSFAESHPLRDSFAKRIAEKSVARSNRRNHGVIVGRPQRSVRGCPGGHIPKRDSKRLHPVREYLCMISVSLLASYICCASGA